MWRKYKIKLKPQKNQYGKQDYYCDNNIICIGFIYLEKCKIVINTFWLIFVHKIK